MTVLHTRGDPIRSLLRLYQPVDEEARITVDEDGWHSDVVNASNTVGVHITMKADGFEQFNFGEQKFVGQDVETLADRLSFARKGRGSDDGDSVTIAFAPDTLNVNITRSDAGVRREFTRFHIDPKTIRQGQDIRNYASGFGEVRAKVAPEHLLDASNSLDQSGDAVRFAVKDGNLYLRSNGDEEDKVVFEEVAFERNEGAQEVAADGGEVECDGALLSTHFVKDIAKTLKDAKMERVVIDIGDEVPVIFRGENNDWGIEATYMVAPRVQDDDDDDDE